MSDMSQQLLRIEKAAELLDCHPRKARRLFEAGTVPGLIRLGRSVRVSPVVLGRFIAGEQQEASRG